MSKENYSKLFELLISIPGKEHADLREFAELTTNNLSDQSKAILGAIIKEISLAPNGFTNEKAIAEKIKQYFFKSVNRKVANQNWNYAKTALTAVLNQYIVFQQTKEDLNTSSQILLNYCLEHKLEKNLNSLIKNTQRNYEKKNKDYDTDYLSFKLQETILTRAHGQRIHKEELEKMDMSLDDFYFENKIRMMVEKYNRYRIINSPEPEDRLLGWIASGKLTLRKVGGKLFLKLFQMMTDPAELNHYIDAKDLFVKNRVSFSAKYKRSICEYLMNQCIYYCHHGRIDFAKEYIEYIKYLIKEKILPTKTGLSISKYANTIYMALGANDQQWAEEFVKKYSPLVDHDEIDSIKKLSLANVLFHKGNHNDEALKLLIGYKFSEIYFRITFDKLCIKLFFEEKMDVLLKSKLNAFQKYIDRSKNLPDLRKIKNTKFIRAVRALMKDKLDVKQLDSNNYLMLDYLWLKKERRK